MHCPRNFWLFIAALYLALCGAGASADRSKDRPPPDWPWRGVFMAGANLPWNGKPRQGYGTATTTSPADIDHFAQLGVNAIAIGLTPRQDINVSHILAIQHPGRIAITEKEELRAELAHADSLLDECKKDGVVGIITLSQFPFDPTLGITQSSPSFWHDPAQLAETLRRIGQIARHFAARGNELGAYDFLTEPLETFPSGRPRTPAEWISFRAAIIKTIRKYDQRHYIVISGGFGGEPSAYRTLTPVENHRIIYSFHMYDPHAFTHQAIYSGSVGLSYPQADDPVLNKHGLERLIEPVVEFQRRYDTYIYVGEFSAVRWAPGAVRYLSDLIDIFDRNHFGWVYFAPGGWNGWDPSFDTTYYPNALGVNDFTHYIGANTPRWHLLERAWRKNLSHAAHGACKTCVGAWSRMPDAQGY